MNSHTHQKLRFAVLALLAAGATALAAPAPAPVADPDPQATPVASTSTTTETTGLEEVVVTGTRIKAPNIQAASPVVVITAKDIQLTGKTDVSDILYQLPQNFNNSLGQDFSNNTPGLTSAGGVTTADLRGLGPNRTLVLIDGIRLGYGSPNTRIASPAPDLDQIPSYTAGSRRRADRRRFGDLRLGCDRGRGQLHHEEELRGCAVRRAARREHA